MSNRSKAGEKMSCRTRPAARKQSILYEEEAMRKGLFMTILSVIFCVSAAAQKVDVKPSKGIAFKGENSALQIGGRIQARHTYDGEKELSSFSTPRVRLALKGTIYKNFKWEFQSDFAKKGAATLKDGLVEFAHSSAFNVRFGQYKIRFDRQQLESSGRQTFVDRALAAGRLGLGRDVGVLVHGSFAEKKIQYSTGLFNGAGEGGANIANRNHMIVGRLSFNPMGDFGLSQSDIKPSKKHLIFLDAAIAHQPEDDDKTEPADTRMVGGAGYRNGGIYLAGEYYMRTQEAQGVKTESSALYAQAGLMVVPEKLEFAARYSTFDPNTDVDDNIQSEIMGGINFFFNKLGHSMKLTVDAAMVKDQAKGDDSYFRSRVQFQLVF